MEAKPTEPRRRGRRPAEAANALTKERIVQAALAQLDAHGLAAFSVREVAKALHVYPAAIYWHVSNRNQLLAEMVGSVLRDLAPPGPRGTWQDWLRQLFRRYRQAIALHPNIAPLIGAQLVSNASLDFGLIETVLEVLSEAGFRGERLVQAFSVVTAAQVGFATLEFAPPPAENGAEWSAEMQRLVFSVDAERTPLLARHLPQMANRSFTLRWQSGTEMPMAANFDLYVETVIAGLEAMAAKD
jgi:TetR/AcrR family transcriptional regulator, tetracycline repressor protein